MQAAGCWRRAFGAGTVQRRACRVFGRAAPGASVAARRVAHPFKVPAAASTEATSQDAQLQAADGVASQQTPTAGIPDLNLADLQVEELDTAQEQLLAWMMSKNEQEQEEDLDEMVDYDEFADDEYAELHEAVEGMIEESITDINVGDTVLGRVYHVDVEGAYVEVGQKGSGFVPLEECSFAKLKTPLEALRVDMVREFVVLQQESKEGMMVLSLAAIEASVFWQRMRQMLAEQAVVKVRVESANRGGLAVKYGPLDGFIPVGQFGQTITLESMEALIGQQLDVKFSEVDEENERLVFSRRQMGDMMQPTRDIKAGDVLPGVVQVVKPYGAFVDIGGATGLLHLSHVSSQRVTSMDRVLKEGDKIKVLVLSVDADRGRITLSTRKLEANPGDMLKDPQSVYEQADQMGAQFRERMQLAKQLQAQAELDVSSMEDYSDDNASPPPPQLLQ